MTQVFLRMPNVLTRTSLSRSSVYDLMSKGCFPKQIKLSERAVGWLESEIDDWMESRIEASKNKEVKQ